MKFIKITTLDKGWHDTDELLLHVVFQLLVDFMEKERPEKVTDWSCDQAHRKAWKDIKGLYKWWQNTRPNRKSPIEDKSIRRPPVVVKKVSGTNYREIIQPDRRKYSIYYQALKKHMKLEEKWYREDQLMLHKLIEVRKYLWT
jgi:hypothetical protein